MSGSVLHLVRKFLPLTYSFVRNQIDSHIAYRPYIVFKEFVSGGPHAKFLTTKYPFWNLETTNSHCESFLYQMFRYVTRSDLAVIRRIIHGRNIDVLHFHFGTDAGMYYRVMKEAHIPCVVSFYGYDCSSFPHRMFGYGTRFLQRRVFPYATRILAMTEDMKRDLLKIGCPENKIAVHYYGTDVPRFVVGDRQYVEKETVQILILCSLSPQKGHAFLLQSIAGLVRSGVKNLHLRIVGEGMLEESLKRSVVDEGLDEYVTFVGCLDYASPEMLTELRCADVFVHPSVTHKGIKEGIPGAVVEAMSAGLPVISTYHAGIASVMEDGTTGLLVREWDVGGLSKAIERLMSSRELREQLGTQASVHALKNLDLKAKERELEALYDDLRESRQLRDRERER
jgi:colanic acid/amylovoran biosynthesis glycosyltransferase